MRIRGSVVCRALLGAGLVLGLAVWTATSYNASASGETRTISFYNIHTKENITVTYKRDGKFDADALKQLNHFMRDWRKDQEREMDPDLIDLIWKLHRQLGSHEPVHLICGYRTAATNASLRRRGGGQAKHSQHILGKAADITFPDVPVKTLRNSALIQEHGGVGYYPTSGIPFVHVDTGNVRMWPRIPRLELAALFPDGRTKYLPRDGKPITPADYRLALAKGMVSNSMVASLTPLPERAPRSAQPEEAASMPKPILASFTPSELPLGPAPASREPPPPSRLFALAGAGGGGLPFLRPSLKPKDDAPPLYRNADVVSAPEVDDDHPEELSYVPFEIADLMTDSSVAFSRTVAPLVHPDQSNTDALLDGMDQPTALTLRKSSGYVGLAATQRFTGHAVKSFYAEAEPAKRGLTQIAQSTR
jgi:uncharacterized protein YcbK (DUF882 family)